MPSKKEIFNTIKEDYPHLPDDIINTVLELNEKDSKYIDDIIREEKKKHKTIPKVKRQIDINDLDFLTSIFKKQEQEILKNNSATIVKANEEVEIISLD